MKLGKTIFIIVVLIFAILKFTVPSETALKEFANTLNRDTILVTTEYEKQLLFSTGTIHHSRYNGLMDKGKPINYVVPYKSEKYLGILGKYWKLN